jgi:fatty acid desaturase
MLAQGIVLVFLFCALHESIHRTAFDSRRMNDAVAWICGALLLLPPGYFRLFHFAHHRFTQDPARDPELSEPHPTRLAAYLWRATGLPNWRRRLSVTLRHAVTGRVPEAFVPAARRAEVVREARVLWACYLAVLVISVVLRRDEAFIYWILPAIAGQPFLRLYLAAEHTGCATSGDPFANTRTTYTNRWVRFLAWQMPFHVEHHAFPSVPFHALDRVNAVIRGRIEVAAPGYVAVQRALLHRLAGERRDSMHRPAPGTRH